MRAPFRPFHRLLRLSGIAALLCAGAILPDTALAHRVTSVSLLANLDSRERTYQLDAAMEVMPSEEASVNEQISPEDAAREFAGYLSLLFDQAEETPEMTVHLEAASDEDTPPELRRQQVMIRLSGKIPEGAKEFLLYLDPRCPMAVVMVAQQNDDPSRRMQVILSGEYSRPIHVGPLAEGDPFENPGAAPAASVPTEKKVEERERGAGPSGPFRLGWQAFFHGSVLPAFLVLATFLLTLGRTSVLRQAGVLLAGCGIVAALAAFSLVKPQGGSESVLAVLVAILAGEALVHRHVRWWRYPLILLAAVALGLFLAGTPSFRLFVAAGLPGLGRVSLLLLGIVSGFVLVGLALAALLLPLSRFESYRKWVVTPLAVLVVGGALYVAVSRFL